MPIKSLLLTAFAAFALSSCSSQPADTRAADEKAVREQDAAWSKAAGARDLEGTVGFYSDDAYLLPPNAPLANGKDAIRASWAPLLAPGNTVSWEPTHVDVARSGELAYLLGTYRLQMQDAQGKTTEDHGKMLEVWKKEMDGKWKCVADTYNSDVALPAPTAAKKPTSEPKAAASKKVERRRRHK